MPSNQVQKPVIMGVLRKIFLLKRPNGNYAADAMADSFPQSLSLGSRSSSHSLCLLFQIEVWNLKTLVCKPPASKSPAWRGGECGVFNNYFLS
jgi:hypothetical protein